jgi:hypothetical protein
MLFDKIENALCSPGDPFFYIEQKDGRLFHGNEDSYYIKNLDHEFLLFDVGNTRVLANINKRATIRELTFYRGCYVCDDDGAGKWVMKDFSKEGPFSFTIRIGDDQYCFSELNGDFKTDLLLGFFPRTTFSVNNLEITILSFAPISKDSKVRLAGLIYGIYVRNTGKEKCDAALIPPEISNIEHMIITYPEEDTERGELAFTLVPEEGKWIPVLLSNPGENHVIEIVREKGTLYWLNETVEYFNSLTGFLEMPDDPLTASIFKRMIYLCHGTVATDAQGKVVGANWGTYPSTSKIWNKDMYYACLPFAILDPEYFKNCICWFFKYGIRERDNRYKGGVTHSLSNSLSSVVMCCILYETTGDVSFIKSEGVWSKIKEILQKVLVTRNSEEVCLFPSIWISDALSLGKYHTGSNIIAWKAFAGSSRIAFEIFKDEELGRLYADTAEAIKDSIEKYMTTEGKFGIQYLEGIAGLTSDTQRWLPFSYYGDKYEQDAKKYLTDVLKDGMIDLMMHDGEESDTTLMSFYKYQPYDYNVFRNYLKFSMSQYNPTYGDQCRGIKWGACSGATFPGYTSSFAAVTDRESMNGERGYMTELKHLTDHDGSWWWWPYIVGAKTGDVVRNNHCGKCGWAAGVFTCLFISEILGIKYDAPKAILNFRPFSPGSGFSWKHARYGSGKFSFEYVCDTDGTIKASVINETENPITGHFEFLKLGTVYCNNKKMTAENGIFLEKPTVKVTVELKPGERYDFKII